MQVLQNHASASPFATDKFIAAAAKSITPADKKTIAAVDAEIGRLNAIAGAFAPDRPGQRHPLDEAVQAAGELLASNPTEAAALELHNLIVRKTQCQLTSEAIAQPIRLKTRALIDTMVPIATGIIDRAEAAFVAEAEAHAAATKNATTFASDTAGFAARLEASRAAFSEKRRWIAQENASAHFLFLELGLTA